MFLRPTARYWLKRTKFTIFLFTSRRQPFHEACGPNISEAGPWPERYLLNAPCRDSTISITTGPQMMKQSAPGSFHIIWSGPHLKKSLDTPVLKFPHMNSWTPSWDPTRPPPAKASLAAENPGPCWFRAVQSKTMWDFPKLCVNIRPKWLNDKQDLDPASHSTEVVWAICGHILSASWIQMCLRPL